ncbi:MAG: ATP-binding cassette domain-containing protein [Pelomonas sp.]|nr:ATP-binding cassette domain-containing protein [Roseateles sp.]
MSLFNDIDARSWSPSGALGIGGVGEASGWRFWDAARERRAEAPGTTRQGNPAAGLGVALAGVAKSYGAREVLADVALQIRPGEFVAVVGRSGCGKSTLLRLLAGLEAPSRGTLGSGAASLDAQRDAVRIMYQDARLLPWKRVLDNVGLGLPGADARDRARAALAQVGLADRARDWPAQLSGGQRQRVALARALVHAPRLLLLDEPLGALDALTRLEMQGLIEDLWRRERFTALLVTHDVAEAVALADRVLLIEDGRVALDEPVPLPRPRRRGDLRAAGIEARILQRVLREPEVDAAHPAAALAAG